MFKVIHEQEGNERLALYDGHEDNLVL